jgi:hypothetical protein
MASAATSAWAVIAKDIHNIDLITVCGDVKSLLVPNTLDELIVENKKIQGRLFPDLVLIASPPFLCGNPIPQNKQEAIAVPRLSPIELFPGRKRLF